jgi:ACS family hexuronate transporter-like MFS transporter
MSDANAIKEKVGNHRWTICALLFFATTINYMDRQILGILAPTLQKEIGWNEIQYGWIISAFSAAYALGLVFAGWFVDKYGAKIGYSLSIVFWSIAAMAHAFARTPFGFGIARAGLGFSEAGNFPAAIKVVAEWFPKKERAFAIGVFNAGSNVGAIVAPLVVPWIALTYGWQEAFIFTGAIGFLWLLFWILLYSKPEQKKGLSPAELAFIQSDPPDPQVKIPWLHLLEFRQTWAFAIGKFMTDPIWWFYLYWVPKFLNKTYGLTLLDIGLPIIVIYVLADVGSVGGGWYSSFLIKRGWTVEKGRKTAMLVCAISVLPMIFASQASEVWMAVALLGLATAAHQGWSANLFATVSDSFPRSAVGSVTGFGGMAGSVGAVLFSASAGYILELTGSYMSLFIISGFAYLGAFGIRHLLMRNAKPIELSIE